MMIQLTACRDYHNTVFDDPADGVPVTIILFYDDPADGVPVTINTVLLSS